MRKPKKTRKPSTPVLQAATLAAVIGGASRNLSQDVGVGAAASSANLIGADLRS